MNFFNIGPMELLFILVLALIIFGPGKLPEVARGLGKAINDFRRASQGLTDELSKELSTTPEAAPEESAKPAQPATEAPKESTKPVQPATEAPVERGEPVQTAAEASAAQESPSGAAGAPQESTPAGQ